MKNLYHLRHSTARRQSRVPDNCSASSNFGTIIVVQIENQLLLDVADAFADFPATMLP